MNDSDITIRSKIAKTKRSILIACLVLLLVIAFLFFNLLKQNPKSDPTSDKLIIDAAAEMLNMDTGYFIENGYFDEVYHLNLSHMPIIVPKNSVSPKYVFVSKGNIIKPIFGLVEISNIRYIEKFPNLESVDLKICFPKKNIPVWMMRLSKLGIFDINKKFSIDLKPLAKLHRLRMIDLAGSQIKDIEPLEGLNELEILIISYTQVNDIKPVRKLTKLKTLDISSTEVSNLEFLRNLDHLQKLELRNCKKITNEQIEELQKALPNLEIVK